MRVILNQGTEMLILCPLLIRPAEILESVARSLFTINEYTIGNVYLYESFLLSIMFVKNMLLQLSFTFKHYQFKAEVNI